LLKDDEQLYIKNKLALKLYSIYSNQAGFALIGLLNQIHAMQQNCGFLTFNMHNNSKSDTQIQPGITS
jgi:hypothetical protein